MKVLTQTGISELVVKIKAWCRATFFNKDETTLLSIDSAPTSGSSNLVTSGGVYSSLANKQDAISDLATIRSGAELGATAYQKPSGGIPKTDLASAVQTSLGKADSAVQPETGKGLFSGNYNDLTNKPTIPTVPTNVSAFTNDAGYLTQHQSLAAYRTSAAQDVIDAGKVDKFQGTQHAGKMLVVGTDGYIALKTAAVVTQDALTGIVTIV